MPSIYVSHIPCTSKNNLQDQNTPSGVDLQESVIGGLPPCATCIKMHASLLRGSSPFPGLILVSFAHGPFPAPKLQVGFTCCCTKL